MGIATTTLTFDLPDNHDKSQKGVPSVVSPSSSKKRSVRERINTSQRSPLSTSPRTRTVDNSGSTPRQRICSRALVSIPSQSVSSPSPNNKPSSPAAVSATTVLHAHRFRLRYEVRKQAKKSRFEGWDTCEGFWSGLLSRRLCWMFGRLDGWFAHTRSM